MTSSPYLFTILALLLTTIGLIVILGDPDNPRTHRLMQLLFVAVLLLTILIFLILVWSIPL